MSNLSDILGAGLVSNEELAMRHRLGFSSTTQQVQTAAGKFLNIVMISPAPTAASKVARIIDRKFINASTTSVTTVSYSGIARGRPSEHHSGQRLDTLRQRQPLGQIH